MKVLKTLLVFGLMAPAPMLAASSTDIKATGSAPTFCNISNDGGAIAMAISGEGDKLSGDGKFSFVANGNAKVLLSAIDLIAPNGAAEAIPSIDLEGLVVNKSASAEAASQPSGGVIRKQGAISAAITQNNSARLLTAGDYAVNATATCTSL
ncbi:MAG: hypothetical protein QM522_12070 [Chitinophagaceae bacterium]|jgi:hypothetical protein|nr:hypothetical protein [Chitinophagaceae bacterium]